MQPLVLCVVLVSGAVMLDFGRMAPYLILSQCRAEIGGSNVVGEMAMHAQWFPFTTVVMVGLIWPTCTVQKLRAQFPIYVLRSLFMLLLMGVTMSVFGALARALQQPLTADAMVSAMVSAMAFYHLTLNLISPMKRPIRRLARQLL